MADTTKDDELRELVHMIQNADTAYDAMKFITQYGDQLEREASNKVTRFEVIDHRECIWCRGDKAANYLQKDGSYKAEQCRRCVGSGIMGGRVYQVHSNPERSIIKLDLSYQDEGRTLKVFVNDKETKQW